MSIVIQGMEMPKTCDDCFLPLRYCPYAMKENGECPIIPLPEGHGRLIDADELLMDACEVCEVCGDGFTISGFSREQIENAPTIVPAEGGGE